MAYKRGPASSGQYLIVDRKRVPREFADVALRRVMPFLDTASLQTRPLYHIMQEVYLQGIRDAVDTLDSNGRIITAKAAGSNPPPHPPASAEGEG